MKKNLIRSAILPVAILLLAVTTQAQITIPAKIKKAMRADGLPGDITIPENLLKKDIDLSASAINFSVVSVKDQFKARVKIEGVVKNVGRLAYTSGANQQTALLYEENGGAYRLVASRSFQNLGVNGTVKVSFTRDWDKSSPAEGEFPPNYILVIGFDPDIYIDGNNNNDDSSTGNNRLTKSGSAINALTFRR